MGLIFGIVYFFLWPFFYCKVQGKENIQDDDEARVFLANHYEIFGPVAMYVSFPLKFRPWIIDKMMDEACVEQQMSLMIMNNYKHIPVWLKKVVIRSLKSLMVFVMKVARGISVSRENPRSAVKTFSVSTETLEKNESVVIFPELLYVKESIGEFQTGFEHFAKYYHKKTGKHVTIYPVFISQELRTMYIGEPIKYSPESEKFDLIKVMHDRMEALYFKYEASNKRVMKKRAKRIKREQKKQDKLNKKAKNKTTDKKTNNNALENSEK